MTAGKLFRGAFWILIALGLVFHVAGGWYLSAQLIKERFTPVAEPFAVPGGDFILTEAQYKSPLGEMNSFFLPASGTTWVIHVHGEGETPDQPAPLFAAIQDAGYPQLAISYRNDDSAPPDPSGYYQYGTTEWEDVSSAVDYAQAHGAAKIVLSGFSAGAAHIMSFLLHRSIDAVTGVLMDSPNVDFGAAVDWAESRRDLPLIPVKVPATVTAITKFFTSLGTGVNWKLVDYVNKADLIIKQPVLIHHGTGDQWVPIEVSVELAQAKPDMVRLIEVPGAGHDDSFNVDPEKYIEEVLSFLRLVG